MRFSFPVKSDPLDAYTYEFQRLSESSNKVSIAILVLALRVNGAVRLRKLSFFRLSPLFINFLLASGAGALLKVIAKHGLPRAGLNADTTR